MILTCASCLTRYYADDTAIGSTGRSVRCAACGHTWFAEPSLVLDDGPSVTAAAPADPEMTRTEVERMRRAAAAAQAQPPQSAAARYRAQQSERARAAKTRALATAWAGTGAALAASAAGAVLFRQDVAEIWPKTASAFAAVGLDVNIYGLDVADLAVEKVVEGATPVLLVSGEVRNIGREEKAAPPIRLTLRDAHSSELFEIVYAIGGRAIAPGGAQPFQLRVENPPGEAVDLEAAFASAAEAQTAVRAPEPGAPAFADGVLDLGPEAAEAARNMGGPDGESAAEAAPSDAPRLRLSTSSASEEHG
ncbi:MAG: zinc-ribbon domain-containing protein [Hyphomonadaceae bacterium]|nr:zinc-ribbon domain-containing protein [Hyphomonadaceae bacterium]